jgi:hypothetical protein
MKHILTLYLVLGTSSPLWAQDQDATLFLLEKVAELESRIEQLESPSSGVSSVAPSLRSWRQLQRGMSYEQVRTLLGEPMKIDGGYATHWYYSASGILGPRVDFLNDRASGWVEPD